MRAAFHEQPGPPDVLQVGELPDPRPGARDVLIRVRASSLDRVDIYYREGSHGMTRCPLCPPHVGGRDIAGEVVAVGAEVKTFAVGARVVSCGYHTHAELAVAPAALTFALPRSCSFVDGGAIPTAGRTAYAALTNQARIKAGEDVLVFAAGSGVGSFAVQIARAAGCRVIATAGSADKLRRARELGAECVIDHYAEDVAARVAEATNGRGVDVVIDHVGTPVWKAAMLSLAPWGRFVSAGVTAGHRVDLHLGQVFAKGTRIMGVGRPGEAEMADAMAGLLRLIDRRQVRPIVHATFALENIAEAHRMMERSDFFGKIVLMV
ncbi:MAG: zinc-binding dehydrogenase [Candidatus Binatia bacterium]